MAVFNEPAQWDHTLGNNADASTLPDDSAATAGTASLQKLFQLINATPLEAGGIAPDREDVNALFKYLGDQIFYTQNGGIPSYNAAYDYIPGRVVLYTDNNIYKCVQANGASSTVVAPGTDDAYWQQLDGENDLALKADKDFSNVTAPTQAFKNMSIGWGQPDYTSAIAITLTLNSPVTYIAPSDGFIIYTLTALEVGSLSAFIQVNGHDVCYFQSPSSGNPVTSCGIVPVHKGDNISIQPTGISSNYLVRVLNYAEFVPCKGV